MKKFLPAVTAICAAAAFAAPAMAVTPSKVDTVKFGVLNCDVAGGVGFVFGSTKDLSCTFIPADKNMPKETYVGTIKKFGVDIGVTGKTVMSWAVVAPADSKYGKGELAGEYYGPSASASAAAGVGANVLLGGGNDSFTLQPVSVQAQEGLNVAAGIADLTLETAH